MTIITVIINDHDDDPAHQDECGSGARSGNAGFNVSWWKLPVEQRCPHLSTPELRVAQYKIQNTKYKMQNANCALTNQPRETSCTRRNRHTYKYKDNRKCVMQQCQQSRIKAQEGAVTRVQVVHHLAQQLAIHLVHHLVKVHHLVQFVHQQRETTSGCRQQRSRESQRPISPPFQRPWLEDILVLGSNIIEKKHYS